MIIHTACKQRSISSLNTFQKKPSAKIPDGAIIIATTSFERDGQPMERKLNKQGSSATVARRLPLNQTLLLLLETTACSLFTKK